MELLDNMGRLDEKSNNEIQVELKQLQLEHEALKISMVKHVDTITSLKERINKEFSKMEEVEKKFDEGTRIIVRRLKGEI